MKRILELAAALLVAALVSGCAARSFTLFPTGHIVVMNDCPGSILIVSSINREEGRIRYGDKTYVSLASLGPSYRYLTAQGVDATTGTPLGSTSQPFSLSTEPYGPDEYVWHVSSLQGGIGCAPIRYRSLLERLGRFLGETLAAKKFIVR